MILHRRCKTVKRNNEKNKMKLLDWTFEMEIWSKYGPNTNIQQRQRKKSHKNTHIQSVASICFCISICIDIHLRCDCFIIFINMTYKLVKMNWLIKFRPMETTLNRFANTDRKKKFMVAFGLFVCLWMQMKYGMQKTYTVYIIHAHANMCTSQSGQNAFFAENIYIYIYRVWFNTFLNYFHIKSNSLA